MAHVISVALSPVVALVLFRRTADPTAEIAAPSVAKAGADAVAPASAAEFNLGDTPAPEVPPLKEVTFELGGRKVLFGYPPAVKGSDRFKGSDALGVPGWPLVWRMRFSPAT